eukprot:5996391-Ditylum_brightwellii.AAC.1
MQTVHQCTLSNLSNYTGVQDQTLDQWINSVSKNGGKNLIQGLKEANRSPFVWVRKVALLWYWGQHTCEPRLDLE